MSNNMKVCVSEEVSEGKRSTSIWTLLTKTFRQIIILLELFDNIVVGGTGGGEGDEWENSTEYYIVIWNKETKF